MLLAGFVVASSCAGPGEGVKAEAGYAAATPIITALEAYRQANGNYPSSLSELTPKFIIRDQLSVKFYDNKSTEFIYRKFGNGYELAFSYSGPGTNQCVYRNSAKTWRCYGAY